jgi:hypothetical protein
VIVCRDEVNEGINRGLRQEKDIVLLGEWFLTVRRIVMPLKCHELHT